VTAALRKVWDLHGVIGTGQSLSVGAEGKPARATVQPYRNLKLSLGGRVFPATDPESSRLALVPLVEPIRPFAWRYPGPYPRNVFGETPHTAMANQVTALYLRETGGQGDYVSVHSVVGESGQPMSVIDKTAKRSDDSGHAYASALFEARAITRLAREAGKTYGVAALVLTHGESDAVNREYGAVLERLWRDLNADLQKITGQTAKIPLLLSQQSGTPTPLGSLSESSLEMLRACERNPGELVCTGPKYQYEYVADGVHLSALSYDRLGEKYGQVYFERLVRGVDWRPLSPTRAERSGNVLTVHFHVPVAPLAWDDRLPMPHADGRREWAKGRGFEVTAGDKGVVIEQVEIVGSSVRITCEALPEASTVRVRYAYAASGAPRPGGPVRWGQLRDSDPFVGSTTGLPQPNYAVIFDVPAP
jgi:hypothetical protein